MNTIGIGWGPIYGAATIDTTNISSTNVSHPNTATITIAGIGTYIYLDGVTVVADPTIIITTPSEEKMEEPIEEESSSDTAYELLEEIEYARIDNQG